nr:hypothetical protein [Mesoplasma corruscae]
MKLNKCIDHTLLKSDATESEIIKLCHEAIEYDFATVYVNEYWTPLAQKILIGSNIGITNVIGFPLGASSSEVKAFEPKMQLKMEQQKLISLLTSVL